MPSKLLHGTQVYRNKKRALRLASFTCVLGAVNYSCNVYSISFLPAKGSSQPLLLLGTLEHKGLTNQLSSTVSALYLASLLGWDAVLPHVSSPYSCSELLPDCYEYQNFVQHDFSVFYDVEHIKHYAKSILNLRVHEKIPRGFKMLDSKHSPCPRGCRATYDTLLWKYSKVRGAVVVQGPGIAAGILDSNRHVVGVRICVHAFKYSKDIHSRFSFISKRLRHVNPHVVAIHYRYEPDAVEKNYSGSAAMYLRKILRQEAQLLTAKDSSLYVVSGTPVQNLLSDTKFRSFTEAATVYTLWTNEVLAIR